MNKRKTKKLYKQALAELCREKEYVSAQLGEVQEMHSRAALAEPPRQCDVGTAEEQVNRFNHQCFRYHTGRCSPHCSTIPAKSESECVLKWAQMPYEPEEGGAK